MSTSADHATPSHCENCGAPLQGHYCYACGQSALSPLRHTGHALEEVFESFWHLDGRIFRTLRDLLSPGRVAANYLAGQRVRYIAPLRLFVILSVLTFFVAQAVIHVDTTPEAYGNTSSSEGKDDKRKDKGNAGKRFARADTVAEVERIRAEEMEDLDKARTAVLLLPVARKGIDTAIADTHRQADRRIEVLRAEQGLSEDQVAAARTEGIRQATPGAKGAATVETAATLAELERLRNERGKAQRLALAALPAASADARNKQLRDIRRSNEAAGCRAAQLQLDYALASEGKLKRKVNEDLVAYGDPDCDRGLSFNGDEWDADTNPLTLKWAPAFVNRWINSQVGHGQENIARAQRDPSLWVRALLGAVPSALFLLVPVFALLLKLAYLGSGRGYLEHLVVALYSHAFLCVALLAMFFLFGLDNAWTPHWPPFGWISGLLIGLLWLSMPIYLLLMQKRVYGNGWWLTLLRYFVVGNLYFVLLSFAAVFVAIASLVRM
uniref:DUF3667 domain-containing protein n=1 Tax=Lysobacter cavernae TaxID=1685901 RepID=A0ABV7RPU0_9GAMM